MPDLILGQSEDRWSTASVAHPFDTLGGLHEVDLRDEVDKVVHTYSLSLGDVDVTVIITIEPTAVGSDEHRFYLAMQAGTVERPIAQPAVMKLTVHPRELVFRVFAFPPKRSMPADCLWSLRVWLSRGGIDHRLFSEERLWIGLNPDFYSIQNARFARLQSVTPISKTYKLPIGTLSVSMVASWESVGDSIYQLNLGYEHDGVGRTLLEHIRLRLSCPLEDVHFVIYIIPIPSTPPGATHRLRVWMRAPVSLTDLYDAPDMRTSTRNTVYHRIWALEEFKIGHSLDFSVLGHRTIIATPTGAASNFVSVSEQNFFAYNSSRTPSSSIEPLVVGDGHLL